MPAPVLAVDALWPCVFGLLEFTTTLTYEAWTCIVLIRRPDHTPEADAYERRLRAPCGVVPRAAAPTKLTPACLLVALAGAERYRFEEVR